MARKRDLRWSILGSPKFQRLDVTSRMLFLAAGNHMDRNGVILADPLYLKSVIFFHDSKTTPGKIKKCSKELCDMGWLVPITHDEVDYLVNPDFSSQTRIYSDEPIVYDIPVLEILTKTGRKLRGLSAENALPSSASTSTSAFPSSRRTENNTSDWVREPDVEARKRLLRAQAVQLTALDSAFNKFESAHGKGELSANSLGTTKS